MIEFAIGLTVVLVLGVTFVFICLNEELGGKIVVFLVVLFYLFGIYSLGFIIKQLFL